MRAPDWKDLLGHPPCGCQERKYIMFQAGQLGLWQALLMVAGVAVILYVGVRK